MRTTDATIRFIRALAHLFEEVAKAQEAGTLLPPDDMRKTAMECRKAADDIEQDAVMEDSDYD